MMDTQIIEEIADRVAEALEHADKAELQQEESHTGDVTRSVLSVRITRETKEAKRFMGFAAATQNNNKEK